MTKAMAGSTSFMPARPFSLGTRPVIRWIKGDGKDDMVTRAAIGHATRLFGDRVDYCLTANHISPARARDVLAWATQPVELWMQEPEDNPELAALLQEAGCPPEWFGYWWKWFPERVRPNAPEWVLDGDMVIVRSPAWFEEWAGGRDGVRITVDPAWPVEKQYGAYQDLVDERRFYDGLVSLPPGFTFLKRMTAILRRRPLAPGHDGRTAMEQQGCLAAVFAGVPVEPIPLHEFPFARAWVPQLEFGPGGHREEPWGYHFGHAFKMTNPHFQELVNSGEIASPESSSGTVERFTWLRNYGQWGGRNGWSMHPDFVRRIEEISRGYAGREVLEIGTSRGFLAAILATNHCRVTTVDRVEKGAGVNLHGLDVDVVVGDGGDFLKSCPRRFALAVVDLHGNDVAAWANLWPLLENHLLPGGKLLLYNAFLWKIPEWHDQTGLKWVRETQLSGWHTEIHEDPAPGMIIAWRRDQGLACPPASVLQFDTGSGFTQENRIITTVDSGMPDFSLQFDLPDQIPIKSLAWLPPEGRPCRVKLSMVSFRNSTGTECYLDLKSIRSNGSCESDGAIFLKTFKPMLFLPLEGDIRSVTVKGQWQPLPLPALFAELTAQINDRDRHLQILAVEQNREKQALEQQLQMALAEQQQLQAALTEHALENHHLEQQLQMALAEQQQLQVTLAAHSQEKHALEQHLQALYKSKTYRYTAPARRVKNLLRSGLVASTGRPSRFHRMVQRCILLLAG